MLKTTSQYIILIVGICSWLVCRLVLVIPGALPSQPVPWFRLAIGICWEYGASPWARSPDAAWHRFLLGHGVMNALGSSKNKDTN